MAREKEILAALKKFAETIKAKMSQLISGEPEDQLRGPLENFFEEYGRMLSRKIVCTGEVRLAGRLGKPDYAVHTDQLLTGYVELKAPGLGANPNRFSGHNHEQWKRFRSIPNLIYCDGNEWALYRDGKPIKTIVRMSGDISVEGKSAITEKDAAALDILLTDFLSWQPFLPIKTKDEIDLKAFAALIAPLCRMLRDDVTEALKDPESPLVHLAKDWRQFLFPGRR